MEDIKILRVILKLAVLLAISPFFMIALQKSLLWITPGLIVVALFGLSIRATLRQKVKPKDYVFISSCYFVGIVFLFFAILLTMGFWGDAVKGNSSPILGVLFLIGLWALGILIIYYTSLSRREYNESNCLSAIPIFLSTAANSLLLEILTLMSLAVSPS